MMRIISFSPAVLLAILLCQNVAPAQGTAESSTSAPPETPTATNQPAGPEMETLKLMSGEAWGSTSVSGALLRH